MSEKWRFLGDGWQTDEEVKQSRSFITEADRKSIKESLANIENFESAKTFGQELKKKLVEWGFAYEKPDGELLKMIGQLGFEIAEFRRISKPYRLGRAWYVGFFIELKHPDFSSLVRIEFSYPKS
jgi:hypothetical protein